MVPESWTDDERRFAARAVRRRPWFLALSLIGIAIAATLAIFYAYRRLQQPDYPLGVRLVVVLLVLLNARQNLRQFRYAGLLEKLAARQSAKKSAP